MKVTSTTATQTTIMPVNAIIQLDLSIETKETYEYCVSRMDPNASMQKDLLPNTALPTMTTTQLEASHNLIVSEVVATKDTETNTEEEDTPLYRRKLQKILGVNFIAAATRKYKNLRPFATSSGNGTGTHSNCCLADTDTTSETDYMWKTTSS